MLMLIGWGGPYIDIVLPERPILRLRCFLALLFMADDDRTFPVC